MEEMETELSILSLDSTFMVAYLIYIEQIKYFPCVKSISYKLEEMEHKIYIDCKWKHS